MSLADRIAAARLKPAATTCRTCQFYAAMKPEDRAEFDQWLDDGLPIDELRRLCLDDGLDVSKSSFGEHVRTHRDRDNDSR